MEEPTTPKTKFAFNYESKSASTTPTNLGTRPRGFNAPYSASANYRMPPPLEKELITLRVERPVVGVQFKPHLMIRNKTNSVVERSERLLQLEYLRSKTKHETDCYNPLCNFKRSKRKAMFENLFDERIYCSAECFKACWRPEYSQMKLNVDTIDKESKSNSEILKEINFEPTLNVPLDEIEWEVVARGIDQPYIPNENDIGHVFKVKCTALKSPTHQQHPQEEEDNEVAAFGESSISEPTIMLPFTPPKRAILTRKTMNPFATGPTAGNLNSTVTVLCYNILASIYTNHQLYNYTKKYLLNWKVRRKMILTEILHYGGDLMCLQEVQQDHFHNFFKPELEQKGYKTLFKMKTRDGAGGEIFEQVTSHRQIRSKVDGCLTVYKSDRFKLVERVDVEFNTIANNDLTLHGDAVKRLSKDNVATIAVLSDISSHEVIILVNTHLHWDPEFSDVKLWQANALTKHIENVQQRLCHRLNITPRNVPVILCGDFNSMPGETAVQFLKQDLEQVDKEKTFDPMKLFSNFSYTHHLQLCSMYEDIVGEEPEATNFSSQFQGTLDYVFASQQNVCGLRALEVPKVEDLRGPDETPLPNSRFPSDHVALFVELQLNYSYGPLY